MLQVRVCGGLEVAAGGRSLPDALVGGRQGRLVLAYLACERHRAVRREELAELLWADRLPESWSASLSAVISRLRRLLSEAGLDGAEAIASTGGSYQLVLPADATVDIEQLEAAVGDAEMAAAGHDLARAVEAAAAADAIAARGFLNDDCEWVDRQRDVVRGLRLRAALAVSEAHLLSGAAARAVDAARDALSLDELRESAYRQLMRTLAAAGERGEALRVWERCRIALVEELGIDPSPETEAVYFEILGGTPAPAAVTTALPSGVVTFLLTDIVDSSSLWEKAPDAMAIALERHDTIIAGIVARHGGTLLKSKLEGDATVSVFARASDGATAALALHDALAGESWPENVVPRVRMAMHTGEAFERGGDYFGPALNRAARLRSLAGANDVLLSQAVTELVRDHLPAGAGLKDLGHRDLRGLSRGENVYALTRTASPIDASSPALPGVASLAPPELPPALSSAAPFVGRDAELEILLELFERAVAGAPGAAFIGGEPGVGKSRLAGELAARAHAGGAIVLYGRCDEDLAAPLQPFIEALRTLVPALGPERIRGVRGVDELARVVPELAELLPDRAPAVRADPDTERLALFDAITNVIAVASHEAPVVLVLDDLHWAGKTTLSLLRHMLRSAKGTRVLVVGTYRDTELARTHPLAETLADLRRDAAATRVSLSGLAAADIDAYLAAIGVDDRALGRELAEVTSGNPFFLIEVLRHVQETGGTWSRGNLPEGVREATGRRLSRLSDPTNRALSVAAVVGPSFDLALIERLEGTDLVDEIAEACQAGLVIEEPGSVDRFRFAHALVRQVLLAELVTVKRVRLHRAIAELLETSPVGDDPDARLADLAYHWSECAAAGDAAKAVDACRRAADRAMERLAYEEAGDLYGMALQVLDDVDDQQGEIRAALHLARCDALLTAGDVAGARAAIDALESAAEGSEHLAAWYTTYEGLLAVLAEPDRLPEIVQSVGAAAAAMRAFGDLRGEARSHYVHATALERLGQIGAAERALDAALAAARSADDRRLADAILAEGPPAALWGPRSVTRASGSCLDVIRVLRVNEGAPAVESVALRCQAVLEALRGRDEAARRMVASARRTVERLGLTHRQLETEVAAGLIELLAGDSAQAEQLLRPAYEGLRDRGLGGEAAQAAAFLGRALLSQDRVDEADEVAAEAESLAGADLKAAIAWRGVRAEAAARMGDPARALALAHEAVDLAAATDALLLVADARLALATVLRATGDERGAEAETLRAIEACEAKGATALAARARGAISGTDVTAQRDRSKSAVASSSLVLPPCAALDAAIVWYQRLNRGAIDEIRADHSPDFSFADRRPLLEAEEDGRSLNMDLVVTAGAQFDPPELLVARERAALLRWHVRVTGAEWTFLVVLRVDTEGRLTDFVMFDVADRGAANVELDRLTPEELEVDNTAWRAIRRLGAATNANDRDTFTATVAPPYMVVDHRRWSTDPIIEPGAAFDALAVLDDHAREFCVVELYGDRRALVRDVVWLRDGAVSDAEVVSLLVVDVDDTGLICRHTYFDPNDVEVALAELRGGSNVVPETPATRAALRFADAINAHDWAALVAAVAPDAVQNERSRWIKADIPTLESHETLFSLDDWSQRRTVIATNGDHRVLVRDVVWFRDGAVGDAEVEALTLVEVDAAGLIVRMTGFDPNDMQRAMAALHAADQPTVETLAWRSLQRMAEAINQHDWNACSALLSPGCLLFDHRVGVTAPDATDGFRTYEILFSLDDYSIQRTLIEASGAHHVLVHDVLWFRDGEVADSEVDTVNVFEVDDAGLIVLVHSFAPDDLDSALAALRSTSAVATPAPNEAWRVGDRIDALYNARDRDALVALHSPQFAFLDRRTQAMAVDVDGADAVAQIELAIGMAEFRMERRLLATRGEHLVLSEVHAYFRDGAAGPGRIDCISVSEIDDAGLLLRNILFDETAMDDALAELDTRFASGDAFHPRQNAAWELDERQRAATALGDWDAYIDTFDPSFEYVERRRGLSPPPASDPLAIMRTTFEVDDLQQRHTLLASRGEHLALVRKRCTFRSGHAGPAEVIAMVLAEVNDEGLQTRVVAFDADDLDAAVAELDARWAVLQRSAPRPNLASETSRRMVDAVDRHDWDALVALMHPQFRYDDRRTSLWVPDGDPLPMYRTLFELDEVEMQRTPLATQGEHAVLTRVECRFRAGAAGWSEVTMLALIEVATDGRIVRETAFEIDDLDAAMEDLRSRSRLEDDPLAIPVNRAARAAAKPGWGLVAALGEHVCLHDTGERLALHEVDHAGEVVAFLTFPVSDRRAAFDELLHRCYTHYDSIVVTQAMAMSRAMNAHDLPAVRACLAESCVIEDHRRLRVMDLQTVDDYIAVIASATELSPDYCVESLRLDAVEPWGHVLLVRLSGTTTEGVPFESVTLACSCWDDAGLVALIALYEPEDREAALARLATASPDTPK